jgi:hypothetical protein
MREPLVKCRLSENLALAGSVTQTSCHMLLELTRETVARALGWLQQLKLSLACNRGESGSTGVWDGAELMPRQ